MKTALKVLASVQVLTGILFICAMASDIQLGFGLVFLFQGIGLFMAASVK